MFSEWNEISRYKRLFKYRIYYRINRKYRGGINLGKSWGLGYIFLR